MKFLDFHHSIMIMLLTSCAANLPSSVANCFIGAVQVPVASNINLRQLVKLWAQAHSTQLTMTNLSSMSLESTLSCTFQKPHTHPKLEFKSVWNAIQIVALTLVCYFIITMNNARCLGLLGRYLSQEQLVQPTNATVITGIAIEASGTDRVHVLARGDTRRFRYRTSVIVGNILRYFDTMHLQRFGGMCYEFFQ